MQSVRAICRDIRGFTLIEVLLVVGVVSILGSVSYNVASNAQESSRERKLEADVRAVNNGVELYRSNGGTIASSSDANAVLDQLKTRADTASAARTLGLTGSFLDSRAEAIWQTEAEAATSQSRAVWSSADNAFVLRSSGPAGIKAFRINTPLSAAAPITEARARTKDVATERRWVWDYTEATSTVERAGLTPEGVQPASNPSGTPPAYLTTLTPPSISPTGGSLPLISFDVPVTISNTANPSGSSQVYFRAGAAWALYSGQTITATPGTQVQAVAFSLDPTTYQTSSMVSETYTVSPLTLQVSITGAPGTMTYQQAGGAMQGVATTTPNPASVSLLSAAQIPDSYESSSRFRIRYTLDGSSPISSGTAVNGVAFSNGYVSPSIPIALANWGSASTLTISAAAQALDTAVFRDSPTAAATITITRTSLATPTISPSTGIRSTDVPVTIALASGQTYPTGARIVYTTNGVDPGSGSDPTTGTVYTGSFLPGSGTNGVLTVYARVYGPAGYGQWFTPSALATATYSSPGTPEGALIGNATVNGTFIGSLIYTNELGNLPSNINFNSSARILQGNVFFPGTPRFTFNGNQNTIIQGRQFNPDGTEILPNTDTSRVVDLTGSTSPSNYNVTFNSGAIIQGKVYRRYTPPLMPSVTQPTNPTNSSTYTLNSGTATINPAVNANLNINSGTATLLPGNYGSINTGGTLILGVAGSSTPAVYSIQSMNLNSNSRLQVVGPVILTMRYGLNVNQATMGSSTNPDWLQLNCFNGDFTMNSGATVYAKVVAPNNSVNLNGTFNGSVAARSLTINGNGVALTLPPVIAGG